MRSKAHLLLLAMVVAGIAAIATAGVTSAQGPDRTPPAPGRMPPGVACTQPGHSEEGPDGVLVMVYEDPVPDRKGDDPKLCSDVRLGMPRWDPARRGMLTTPDGRVRRYMSDMPDRPGRPGERAVVAQAASERYGGPVIPGAIEVEPGETLDVLAVRARAAAPAEEAPRPR